MSVNSVFDDATNFDAVEEGELDAANLANAGVVEFAIILEDCPLPSEDFQKRR